MTCAAWPASVACPLVLVIVFAVMIVEARRAAANERVLRTTGGVEARDDVYAVMQLVYPGLFLVMVAEPVIRRETLPAGWFAVGAVIFATAKILKWWAITALGSYWTFRVIVVPGSVPVDAGPYRFLRHPNYVAVVGEIAGVALMMRATFTGPIALVVFGVLLLRRIAVENRARDAILRRG